MLDSISTVTYSVPDPARSAAAIERYLGYARLADGIVDGNLVTAWNAPAMAGRASALLQSPDGADSYVRLIAADPVDGYAPLQTFGWNSAELHVADVDVLDASLEGGGFEKLGGPRDLTGSGAIVALQVKGPGDEVFYLTRIASPTMQKTYGATDARVGRLFIAVLGSHDVQATLDWYGAICAATTRPRTFAIRVLAAAHGLDPETRFPITSACLNAQYRIEIDGYPPTATPRPRDSGCLPPGLGLVSFRVASLDALPLSLNIVDGPAGPPYFGGRIAVVEGPSGEWLELIETPD